MHTNLHKFGPQFATVDHITLGMQYEGYRESEISDLLKQSSEEMEETRIFLGGRRKKSRNVLKQCKRSKPKQYHNWTIPEVEEIRTSEEAQGSTPIARQLPEQEQMRCCLQN